MTNIHKTTDKHVFIAGATGGGKTVVANGMHAEFDGLSIFFNSEEENNVVGFAINSPDQITEAIRQYGTHVTLDYRPSSPTKEGLNLELDSVINYLFKFVDKTGRSIPIQLIVDECQDYAEEGKSEGTLHMAVRKGRKRMIKTVPASQEAARVSKTLVRQCKYNVWCGEFNPYYESYFNSYNLPTDVLKKQDDGYYTIFKGAKPISKHQREKSRYA